MTYLLLESTTSQAQRIVQRRNGRWSGRQGHIACPICQPEQRPDQAALSVSVAEDGKLLLTCHKCQASFVDLLHGLGEKFAEVTSFRPTVSFISPGEDRQKIGNAARRIWNEARSISGTLAEAYLRNRGITADLAGTLRYHPDLWHGPSQMRLPAMIGWVAHPVHVAIHRTWLAPEGKGKAKVPSNKMMLGSVAGGAVQLMEGPGPLVVAEGIETALSLASGFLPHPMRLWAALSASGMRSLILPEQLSTLIIASDGDAVGRAAAQDLGLRSRTRGWTVKTFAAAEGKDWNDELLAQGDAK